ncbi:MAG: alpha/beta hydrolase [Silicimonas sp.]
MKFAPGMEEALRAGETFGSDDEAALFWSEGAPDVPYEDTTYPGAMRQPQRARLYRGDPDAPTLLYIHGGGWCGGSIELNDPAARGMVRDSGWNILSISYRLAPEHPYPAGLDDCMAAIHWLRAESGTLGLRTGPVALGGASAGANLALAASLALGRKDMAALVLFYGVFGHDLNTESHRAYRNGPGLTGERMVEIFDMYDPENRRRHDPLIAPLHAEDLTGMPPACLIAAEHDVLLDDSRRMAARLTDAGVAVEFHMEPGVTHGFINRGRLVPSARQSVSRAASFLKRLRET